MSCDRPTTVLAVGAHPDDVELGCGGTLARHVENGDRVVMLILTHGLAGPGDVARRTAEQEAAAAVLGAELRWGELPDGSVSASELAVVHLVKEVVRRERVDVVYTHTIEDTHQDHRAVAHATLSATRQCSRVLGFESPSSHGFTPRVFVDVSGTVDKKLAALRCHTSQVTSSAMASADLVVSQAGFRGFQARVGAAEGFVPHRLLLEV